MWKVGHLYNKKWPPADRLMTDFTKGENRYQSPLFTERLDDYIAEVSAMCVVDVFIDDLDLSGLGFEGKRTAPPGCKGSGRYSRLR